MVVNLTKVFKFKGQFYESAFIMFGSKAFNQKSVQIM